MNSLDEKLEELGYECDDPDLRYSNYFSKYCKYYYDIKIQVFIVLEMEIDISYYGIDLDFVCYEQKDIDNMQIALKRLKKDIKEIEKWQKLKAEHINQLYRSIKKDT